MGVAMPKTRTVTALMTLASFSLVAAIVFGLL